MTRKHGIDLTKGSVLKKLLVFAFPLCISSLLQSLYHSADVIVVGRFAEDGVRSLAAVGSTTSITNLLLHMFIGISAGVNVLCANRIGSKDEDGVQKLLHTAVPLAVLCGVVLGIFGFFMAPLVLKWMGCPSDVIAEATVYMQIIFLGQPANIVYNFGSGILRAHGDTKRPMYILMVTGLVNVLLNLLFVIGFHMDSAGVALATIAAHYLNAAAILYILFSGEGGYRMSLKRLRLDAKEVVNIAKVGIPAGLNGIVYSISNVIIVSTVNSLGTVAVAATSASTSVSSIPHTFCTSVSAACVSFAGQNFGAKNFKRIGKVYWWGIAISIVFMSAVSLAFTLFPGFFLGLYTDDLEVIRVAFPKLMLNNWGFLFSVIADISNGCLRGMKHASGPTLANMFTVCGTRLIWVLLVFPFLPQTLGMLCVAYPVSWFLCAAVMMVYFHTVKRMEEKKHLLAQ